MNIQDIAGQFATEGSIGEVKAHAGGHINDSYRMVNSISNQPDYLLQRVNHFVFKDVELLMQNMVLVTDHVRAKIKKEFPEEIERRSLTIIPATDGKSYFKDPEGNYWRVLRFIEDHLVFDSTTDPLVRREYEESRRSLQGRLSKLKTVATYLDRIEAQLMSLSNEMEGIVTEVIRLQAMGPQDGARHVPALVKRLREQSAQLEEFEREAVKV